MSRQLSICWLFITCIHNAAIAQRIVLTEVNNGTQTGFALKAVIEMAKTKPVIRVGVSSGVGGFLWGKTLYPSLHADIMLYNHGLGSPQQSTKKSIRQKPYISYDLLFSGTLTLGFKTRFTKITQINPKNRNIPLYYFGNLNKAPLQNPFNYSLSIGSILSIAPRHKCPVQQIGFLNGHIGQFQFCYFNDGTPFGGNLGDGKDRYYTGGGVLSWSGNSKSFADLFELSYYKYTGYVKNAFEISNDLDLSFVPYAENFQNKYNKSMISFSASSSKYQTELGIAAFNQTKWDIQHIIHRYIFNAFHRVEDQSYFTIRAGGFFSSLKIGMK